MMNEDIKPMADRIDHMLDMMDAADMVDMVGRILARLSGQGGAGMGLHVHVEVQQHIHFDGPITNYGTLLGDLSFGFGASEAVSY